MSKKFEKAGRNILHRGQGQSELRKEKKQTTSKLIDATSQLSSHSPS